MHNYRDDLTRYHYYSQETVIRVKEDEETEVEGGVVMLRVMYLLVSLLRDLRSLQTRLKLACLDPTFLTVRAKHSFGQLWWDHLIFNGGSHDALLGHVIPTLWYHPGGRIFNCLPLKSSLKPPVVCSNTIIMWRGVVYVDVDVVVVVVVVVVIQEPHLEVDNLSLEKIWNLYQSLNK